MVEQLELEKLSGNMKDEMEEANKLTIHYKKVQEAGESMTKRSDSLKTGRF